jgi:AcrR family transcriptional regulator
MTFSIIAHDDSPQWRTRALDRSLGEARTRSVQRMERLVDAARSLANESGSAAFTVAQVAERAGLSLKSFYRCFSGKDHLLLALLEEESRRGAAILGGMVDAYDAPVERLRAYVQGIFELLTYPDAIGYAGVLVREHRRLAEDHPDELDAALRPLVDRLRSELASGVRAGELEDVEPRRAAETVFALVLASIHEVTLGRAEPRERAAYLWRFCWSGLAGARETATGNASDRRR